LIKAGGRIIRSEIVNFLIPFRIRRNNLRTGRSQILYPFIRMMIKQIVVIIEAYHFIRYLQNFIQCPAVKVNSMCRGKCWGSSMWISTQQVIY